MSDEFTIRKPPAPAGKSAQKPSLGRVLDNLEAAKKKLLASGYNDKAQLARLDQTIDDVKEKIRTRRSMLWEKFPIDISIGADQIARRIKIDPHFFDSFTYGTKHKKIGHQTAGAIKRPTHTASEKRVFHLDRVERNLVEAKRRLIASGYKDEAQLARLDQTIDTVREKIRTEKAKEPGYWAEADKFIGSLGVEQIIKDVKTDPDFFKRLSLSLFQTNKDRIRPFEEPLKDLKSFSYTDLKISHRENPGREKK